MSSPAPRQSRLAYLVDLAVQLQRDTGRTDVELHRRDRALAGALRQANRDRRSLLLSWLDALRDTGHPLPGHSVGTVYRVMILALVILGLAVGGSAAATVFHYNGTQPVNIVNVLAVFVGTQLLLLVLLAVVILPHQLTRRLPGVVAVQEVLAWLSPGQLTRLAFRLLPRDLRERLAELIRHSSPHRQQLGRVQKWAIVFAAQAFAVAFNVGALAGCLYLITFSDLAFSWSTTLEPNVEKVHHLTQVLATPWGWANPSAVPPLELVRQTLYYRQEHLPLSGNPARWGEWWPFLVACMVTYGFMPRLLLLSVAGWRFRRCVNRALVETPGITVVLDRLTSELVVTQAAGPDIETAGATAGSSAETKPAALEVTRFCLVNWGGLELPDAILQDGARQAWQREIAGVYHAGGRASLDEDARTIATLSATPPETGLALLVKSWEPPVLEFTDFVRDLRQAVGERRLILVVPVSLDDAGALASPREIDAVQWRKRLRALGDPALVVRPWSSGGSS